jgi:hypothetical protein
MLGIGYHFSSKNAEEIFRRDAFAQTSTRPTIPNAICMLNAFLPC